MTDKQIIIDGVDVSKCTYFDNGECLNPCETVTNCEASINCYYKQLKRTESELVRKEQECERLKELLAQDQCFQDRSHKCVKSFYIDERYKQAIEKIKEIVKKGVKIHDDIIVNKQILQICDEVNKDDSIEDDLSGHWLFDKEV